MADPTPWLTENYLARPVDQRMVDVIRSRFSSSASVVDVACGSGLYGQHLAARFEKVFAIDYDRALCAAASENGSYEAVYCDRVEALPSYLPHVDAVFCSEFLEHVPNEQLLSVVGVLESVAQHEIVLTVPNPRSPHFKQDPTHILNYRVRSLLKQLNTSPTYTYRLHPLGFSEYNLTKPHYRLLNPLARRFAALSPTVLYVGKRR